VEYDSERNFKHIREGRSLKTKLAEELCNKLGSYNEDGFTLEDIKHVEELLNIQIKVTLTPLFILEKKEKPKFICTNKGTILT
jgi:hypothetical protein